MFIVFIYKDKYNKRRDKSKNRKWKRRVSFRSLFVYNWKFFFL